jgi:hypothetical protein
MADDRPKSKGFSTTADILDKYQDRPEDKYISREFQQYGIELAAELGDEKHKALYIKLAKETPRGLLESAKSFVKDAPNVKSRGRLFMWKLKQLKEESEKKKSK